MNALYYSLIIVAKECESSFYQFILGETTTGCGKSCLKIDVILIHFARKYDIFPLDNNSEKIIVAMVT